MSILSTGLSNDERLVVSPKRARQMLDCGNTRLYELLKNQELDSYLDGRSRKIIVASIHRHIARRLAAEKTATAERVSGRRSRRRTANKRMQRLLQELSAAHDQTEFERVLAAYRDMLESLSPHEHELFVETVADIRF
jgi:hypothetical protein